MLRVPKWLKITRVLTLLAVPVMFLNCCYTWDQGLEEFEMMWPCTCILVALTHLVFRAPYKAWRWWETPFLMISVLLVSVGAYNFKPEGEEFRIGLQIFIASFGTLAIIYGFFCTAVPIEHPLRECVIEPTKRVARFGIIGADIGLVAAPFAFVFLLAKHYLKKS